MVSVNTALQLDLSDQAGASHIGGRLYSGFGGQPDFVEGALHSPGGHAVIALRSWHEPSDTSTIVPRLTDPVTSFQHSAVITEQGCAHIFGRSQRAQAQSDHRARRAPRRPRAAARARRPARPRGTESRCAELNIPRPCTGWGISRTGRRIGFLPREALGLYSGRDNHQGESDVQVPERRNQVARVGLLTGGGDCPGLNAVIRAVVRRGLARGEHSFVGFRYGWVGAARGRGARADPREHRRHPAAGWHDPRHLAHRPLR